MAGVKGNVTFLHGDALDPKTFAHISGVDAAILDPVWGKTPHDMSPPVDTLVQAIQAYTKNIVLILPPFFEQGDIDLFAPDEVEKFYLDGMFIHRDI